MKDVTPKFIKRMGTFPENGIYQISSKENSRIDKFGKRAGQSPLETTRSSRNSVKTSILSRDMDGLFNGLLCKAVSTCATFVFIMDAVLDRFLTAIDSVSRNRCTKSVIIDAFGVVSPGYFC
ncbi:uncharacterized protein TNCV_4693111 [Trichonephila clavipes]|nr:uncharacterized protein TNCV_4693111 [Trichonephila clavipes]